MSAPAKPRRRVAASIAAIAVTALLAFVAWYGYSEVASQPARHVVFAGAVERLNPADLARLEQSVLAGPGTSIDAIRAEARALPWVSEATVRRVFPDTVEIALSAHTAFARWNDDRLVSTEGQVFRAQGAGELPTLRGPEGSAPRLVREYPLVVASLAPLGSEVKELRLTPRGGWHATLASGLAIALGRGDWRARAERFVLAWPRISPEARMAAYADLRYPGGFALKKS